MVGVQGEQAGARVDVHPGSALEVHRQPGRRQRLARGDLIAEGISAVAPP